MSKGFLIFAENNEQINYVNIAAANAAMIKFHTGLGTTLVSNDDSVFYLSREKESIFEQIHINGATQPQVKSFVGYGVYEKLQWRNRSRHEAYRFSPYDETILLDADYLILNDVLNQCWGCSESIMMSHNATTLFNKPLELPERRLFDTTIPMYWATLFYFRKGEIAKTFFTILENVIRSYDYYASLFNITKGLFRNDYAFSIAAHIMGDFTDGFMKPMPDNVLLTSLHADKIMNFKKGVFNIASRDGEWHYPVQIKQNFHYMNKFDLHENANKIFEMYNE